MNKQVFTQVFGIYQRKYWTTTLVIYRRYDWRSVPFSTVHSIDSLYSLPRFSGLSNSCSSRNSRSPSHSPSSSRSLSLSLSHTLVSSPLVLPYSLLSLSLSLARSLSFSLSLTLILTLDLPPSIISSRSLYIIPTCLPANPPEHSDTVMSLTNNPCKLGTSLVTML